MHVILAPDDRHKEVFPDVPLIGFKNNKSLRDHLVRLKELRKKELYWMYKLKTYVPYGINEREVYEAFSEEIFIPCMYKAITQGGLF